MIKYQGVFTLVPVGISTIDHDVWFINQMNIGDYEAFINVT